MTSRGKTHDQPWETMMSCGKEGTRETKERGKITVATERSGDQPCGDFYKPLPRCHYHEQVVCGASAHGQEIEVYTTKGIMAKEWCVKSALNKQ